MQKTRIEVRANIIVYADAHKAAQFAVDKWCNEMTDMANSNREAGMDFISMELVEFRVHTVISLTNIIYKTCYK